jgi:hypothetical protein
MIKSSTDMALLPHKVAFGNTTLRELRPCLQFI